MTSEHIKKVREAAESSSYLPSACIMDYVPIMRNFALSLVGTDGEQPITDEWLRDEWGWRSDGTLSMHYDRDAWTAFCWSDDGLSFVAKSHGMRCYTKGFPIHTRYQFRLLAAALGIKRKGE